MFLKKKNLYTDLLIKKNIKKTKFVQKFSSRIFPLQQGRKNRINSGFYFKKSQRFQSKPGFQKKSVYTTNVWKNKPKLKKKLLSFRDFQKPLKKSLKEYLKSKKKINTSLLNLKKVKLLNVKEDTLSPLLQHLAIQKKRFFLRQLKWRFNRFKKTFKGPRVRRFSTKQRKIYSQLFYHQFFWFLKNQSLRFLNLKRFFSWYFFLSKKELFFLKALLKNKKNKLNVFIKYFESRILTLLIRTKIVLNPSVFPMILKLGILYSGVNVVKYAYTRASLLQPIFFYSSLLPYSYYRFYLSKIRGFFFLKDITFFKKFHKRRKKLPTFSFRFTMKFLRLYLKKYKFYFKLLNWNFKYLYMNKRAAVFILIKNPKLTDFTSFFYSKKIYFYNFLLNYF